MVEIPKGMRDIPQILNDILRRLKNLETATPLKNAAISSGGISISQGGSLQVYDTGGTLIAQLGALPAAYNRSDGSAQPGLIFYRPDGSLALLLGDRNATIPPYTAAVQIADRAGRIVMADDTNSGHGLANPHVVGMSGPTADTNTATWPGTTNTTLTDISNGYHEWQNPKVQFAIILQADVGATGQFQLFSGTDQLGTTQTVTGGFSFWQPGPIPMPAGTNIGDIKTITLKAQLTSGTGSVRAILQWWTGTQS